MSTTRELEWVRTSIDDCRRDVARLGIDAAIDHEIELGDSRAPEDASWTGMDRDAMRAALETLAGETLAEVTDSAQRTAIRSALESHGWRLQPAARALSVTPQSLRWRLRELGMWEEYKSRNPGRGRSLATPSINTK